MNTPFYDQARRDHPMSMNNATQYTRTGTLDMRRYGGPGTRSKNPKRYDAFNKD